ncbi:MAG: aminotransferase class V-fold PLP-dependent enzyme, partial [Chloroflexota bacterium]
SAGLAFLYVNRDLLDHLQPSSSGWFAQANIFAMDIYANTPSASARRFESGTPPVPNVYAAIAGIKLVRSIGLEKIEAHLRQVTGAIKEGVMRRGFNLVSPVDPNRHGAMITIRAHNVDQLTHRLAEDNIIVSPRDDNLRISPHFYNNQTDVNKLIDCLTKYKDLLV